jgi:hypothetical protein
MCGATETADKSFSVSGVIVSLCLVSCIIASDSIAINFLFGTEGQTADRQTDRQIDRKAGRQAS